MIKKQSGVIEFDGGDILFDNIDLKEISNKYPSPFFLISERQLEDNYNNFLKAFAGVDKFKVFYSVKTDFESEVLKTLKRLGASTEISGGQDFLLAKKAGFSADNVIFDGPCKTEQELNDAISQGVHCINVESLNELKLIEKIASGKNKKVNIGIRIDPLVDRHYYDAVIDTYKRKFGYPITEVKEIYLQTKNFPHLNPIAIHAHIGSQLFDVSLYTKAINKIFALMGDLKKEGIEIKELNIGGGFPAQSMKSVKISRRLIIAQIIEKVGFSLEKKVPSIFDFGKAISEVYNQNAEKYKMEPILITEPGRCIVSNIGVLVGKVIHTKGNWVFTNIGVNDLAENIFFSERDFGFPGKMNSPKSGEFNISGPTLSTADVVFLKKKIPLVDAGDTFVVFDVGAYSISRSTQFTQPRKAVYFKCKNGEVKKMRSEETYEDVIKNQIW